MPCQHKDLREAASNQSWVRYRGLSIILISNKYRVTNADHILEIASDMGKGFCEDLD